MFLALAGVSLWVERRPANRKVAGLIPVRAHAWVASQVPGWGVREAAGPIISGTWMFLSLSSFLPSPLSKNKEK